MSRRIVLALLCLSLIVTLVAAFGIVGFAEPATASDTTVTSERLGVGEGASALDGKKILFAGCSYTYYGGLVERTGASVFSQVTRTEGEKGLFVRLAELNGVKNLTVTDWCYGGHDLTDIFDGEVCDAGEPACNGHVHLDDLTDRNYDIVVLQDILTPEHNTPERYVDSLKMCMDVFLAANPDTEFYLFAHHRLYQQLPGYRYVTASVQPAIEKLGIKVIDWGALVYDVTEGNAKVPGSVIDYNYQSFVVSRSKADGYHQNLLAGYLATVMTYATFTGETTVGQPYEFIYDMSSKYLNIDKYIESYYIYDDPATEQDESVTNMREIFYSKTDMDGLQRLADEYLSKSRWLDFAEYTVEFRAGDEVISSENYKWGEEITVPTAPEKEGDGQHKYTFVGWDTEPVTTCSGSATYTAVYEETPASFIDAIVTFFANIAKWFSDLFASIFGK